MKSLSFSLILLFVSIFLFAQPSTKSQFTKELQSYVEELESGFDFIPHERKQELGTIVNYLTQQKKANRPIKITLLSKDNAYRSQLSQVWLSIATQYYQLNGINAFSAGYTPKKFSPKVANALKRTGLIVERLKGNELPTYKISARVKGKPILTFSKSFANRLNPSKEYIAIFMHELAPSTQQFLSNGANTQFDLHYLAPIDFAKKEVDKLAHDEQCQTIAKEMFYIIYSIQQQLY